ncbi:MAG: radical SAM family heme chaperone HemW [Rickettsiales bacterium]|jgi:oxygen-independent coproporphyrinogen-3 oxidase|nr:radical SAM family heme chaperone HemW [Rickettsiales bacterium]
MENCGTLSIYVHYPFCLSKCPYCDFNSYKLLKVDEATFLSAYLKEIEYYYNFFPKRKVGTIFFGGGTPSLMSTTFLQSILARINSLWGIDNDVEISLEANPSTFEISKFREFKNIGINRLSVGVQSLDDNELKFLGRLHSCAEAIDAVKIANKIFGDRYSVDLIYARPKQKISDWLNELKRAIELSPFHLSLYQLTIEKGSGFFSKNIRELDEDVASKMYSITNDFLESNEIYLYEVSNYSGKGYECQHNLNYWNSGEWIGIGAGAHSRLCFDEDFTSSYRVRTEIENVKVPSEWQNSVFKYGCGCKIKEKLTKSEFVEEILLMGLRLRKGIKLNNVKKYLNINSVRDLCNNLHGMRRYISVSDEQITIKVKYFSILNAIIGGLVIG